MVCDVLQTSGCLPSSWYSHLLFSKRIWAARQSTCTHFWVKADHCLWWVWVVKLQSEPGICPPIGLRVCWQGSAGKICRWIGLWSLTLKQMLLLVHSHLWTHPIFVLFPSRAKGKGLFLSVDSLFATTPVEMMNRITGHRENQLKNCSFKYLQVHALSHLQCWEHC